MSRFDEWAKAAGRGGSLLGAFRRSRRSDSEVDAAPLAGGEAGLDRRQLLKRAGLVGAATVWSTPVVQSVLAPAATAASPGCTPGPDPSGCGGTCDPCALGLTCAQHSDCASGNCSGGVCKVADGQSCVGSTVAQRDANCGSGYCNDSGVCAPPSGSGELNATCHGSTQAAANASCESGLVCDDWTPSNPSGTCLIASGQPCQGDNGPERDANCASGDCTGGARGTCA